MSNQEIIFKKTPFEIVWSLEMLLIDQASFLFLLKSIDIDISEMVYNLLADCLPSY